MPRNFSPPLAVRVKVPLLYVAVMVLDIDSADEVATMPPLYSSFFRYAMMYLFEPKADSVAPKEGENMTAQLFGSFATEKDMELASELTVTFAS